MKSEKEKMLAGELYDALDPQLSNERLRARLLTAQGDCPSGTVPSFLASE